MQVEALIPRPSAYIYTYHPIVAEAWIYARFLLDPDDHRGSNLYGTSCHLSSEPLKPQRRFGLILALGRSEHLSSCEYSPTLL